MMAGEELNTGGVNDAEQVEKKEKSDAAGGNTVEGLQKQVKAAREGNAKLEKTISDEGGREQNERKEGSERLEELIIEEMGPSMQRGLDMNVNTDFSARETDRLRSDYARVQGSKAYVSSHTAESLSGGLQGQLKRAYERYRTENPGDATEGGMKDADTDKALQVLKDAMLKSLQIVDKKITDELQKRGVNPAQEQEKRVADGDQVRTVDAAPGGRDFTGRSRNSMRDFRNLMYRAETADGVRYDRLTVNPPSNDQERDAAKKFSVVTQKFNEALAHCNENGIPAADKNARAEALKDYGGDLLKNPVSTPDTLPSFRDWITQNADKFKAAQERARKSGE